MSMKLISKLQDILNKLFNKNGLNVKTIESSLNKLLETLKIMENCTKDKKIDGDGLYESIDQIESCPAGLQQEEQRRYTVDRLKQELFYIDVRLNKEVLCEGCEKKNN